MCTLLEVMLKQDAFTRYVTKLHVYNFTLCKGKLSHAFFSSVFDNAVMLPLHYTLPQSVTLPLEITVILNKQEDNKQLIIAAGSTSDTPSSGTRELKDYLEHISSFKSRSLLKLCQ